MKMHVALLFALLMAVAAAAAEPRPASSDLSGSLALEMVRQEMIDARLGELAANFHDLVEDLQSNQGVPGEIVSRAAAFQGRLSTLRSSRLASARQLLDAAAKNLPAVGPQIAAARQQVDLAARELASLLLQAGVSQACEVFAVELRDLIGKQDALLSQAAARADAAPAAPSAADGGRASLQRDLAQRTEQLLADLRALRETPTDALALVRLSRATKLVEAGQRDGGLRRAADELAAGHWAAAMGRQSEALKCFRDALLKLRPDARLEALIGARNLFRDLLKAQQTLRDEVAMFSAEQFAAQQETLKRRQAALLRPVRNLDASLEIDSLPAATDKQVEQFDAAVGKGDRQRATSAQMLVEESLRAAVEKLQRQIAGVQALGEAYRRMQSAAERLKLLVDLKDRQQQVKDRAFEAATAGKGLEEISRAQQLLGGEVQHLAASLPLESKYAAAQRRALRRIRPAMDKSAAALKTGRFETAMPELLQVDALLEESAAAAKQEVRMLENLWQFRQAADDIGQLRRLIEDLENEQADLLADLQAAQKGSAKVQECAALQKVLGQAAAELREAVGLVREADRMQDPLKQAAEAMAQAAQRLEQNEAQPAADAQARAVAALRASRAVAADLIKQIDMVLLEVESAAELSGNASDILQRQTALRESTEEAADGNLSGLAAEEEVLRAETEVMAGLPVAPKAAAAFATAKDEMAAAVAELNAARREAGVQRQKKAEEALRVAILALNEYIASLFALANEGLISGEGYIPRLDDLTKLLFLAVQQRELREQTARSPNEVLPQHAVRQSDLKQQAVELSTVPKITTGKDRITGFEHIEKAAELMERAAAALQKPLKSEALQQQLLAEKELRIAFAMNVVELIASLTPPEASATPKTSKLGDGVAFDSRDHWTEFVKAAPLGKAPEGGKAEWQSLKERQRAALNENFMRELPLQFRDLLRDYYETLAK